VSLVWLLVWRPFWLRPSYPQSSSFNDRKTMTMKRCFALPTSWISITGPSQTHLSHTSNTFLTILPRDAGFPDTLPIQSLYSHAAAITLGHHIFHRLDSSTRPLTHLHLLMENTNDSSHLVCPSRQLASLGLCPVPETSTWTIRVASSRVPSWVSALSLPSQDRTLHQNVP
jgi:hypothetical protein